VGLIAGNYGARLLENCARVMRSVDFRLS
jgi:hypothetical protein